MSERAGDTPKLSGEEARQGEIILRRRWRRVVFLAGLTGIVLLAILVPALQHS
jgi:hypothetical protein